MRRGSVGGADLSVTNRRRYVYLGEMMPLAMHAASLLLPLVVMAQAVSGVGALQDPRPTGWVVDQAEVLDAAVEEEVNASLTALHREVGPEVVLVAVHDVPGTPKAFATELFNTWRLGSAEKNDGVLVLMVVKQRRLEIETGDGLQAVLSAAWLSALQAREMIPAFKRGELGAGLRAGVAGIAARLRTPPGEQDAPDAPGAYRSDGELVSPGATGATTRPALGDEAGATAAASRSSDAPPPAADKPFFERKGPQGLLGLLGAGGLLGGGTYWRRRRNRRCKKCGIQRDILDEVADDAHLSPGERAEEKVGSVDHVIFHCPTCETFEHQKRNAIFSRRRSCEGCKHRTALSQTRVVRAPTYSSTGTAEVTTSCSFCSHTSTSRHTLARLTRSSSSSSGSGSSGSRSSYGSSSSSRSSSSSSRSSGSSGGRSSGGGSGSSW